MNSQRYYEAQGTLGTQQRAGGRFRWTILTLWMDLLRCLGMPTRRGFGRVLTDRLALRSSRAGHKEETGSMPSFRVTIAPSPRIRAATALSYHRHFLDTF